MIPRRQSVVFAALLLVAQLLFGVTLSGAMAHDGARHCDGCPSVESGSMSHGMGSREAAPDGDHRGSHCGTHCSHDGSTHTGDAGCGSGCAMMGSGHCGSPASPALLATAAIGSTVLAGSFGRDRGAIDLPDSPLFDFLRPPTCA